MDCSWEGPPFFLGEEIVVEFLSPQTEVEQKFTLLCHQVLEKRPLELYDLEYHEHRGLLRVMICDPQTHNAAIEQCVQIDQILTPFIEQEEWIPDKLTLEISSPGLERPLRSLKHWQQSIGERILLRLKSRYQASVEHRQALENFHHQYQIKGVLEKVEDTSISMAVAGVSLVFPMVDIKWAHWELII